MYQQRLQIKTLGVVGRTIFEEGWRLVRYDHIHLVEVEHDPIWDTVVMYYTLEANATGKDVVEFRRRLTHPMCKELVEALRTRTDAKIFVKESTKKIRPEGA
jgi:hypothetical protein